MVPKHAYESLILCIDREFRARVVNMLNNTAFVAEKKIAEAFADALFQIGRSEKIMNVIIDGALYLANLEHNIGFLTEISQSRPEIRIVIYFDAAVTAEQKKALVHLTNVHLAVKPIDKQLFSQVFHRTVGATRKMSPNHSPLQGKFDTSPKVAPISAKLTQAKTHAFEAFHFLREVLALVGQIDSKPLGGTPWPMISDRFAEIAAAFVYYKDPGYREITALCRACETLTHHLSGQEGEPQAALAHLQEASRFQIKILKAMLAEKYPPAELLEASSLHVEQMKKDQSINWARRGLSQSEIDEILLPQPQQLYPV